MEGVDKIGVIKEATEVFSRSLNNLLTILEQGRAELRGAVLCRLGSYRDFTASQKA